MDCPCRKGRLALRDRTGGMPTLGVFQVSIGVVHSTSNRIWEMVPEQKAKLPSKTNDWLTAFLGYMKPQLPKILYLKSPCKCHNHGWNCKLLKSLVLLHYFKGLSLKAEVQALLEGLHHDQVIPC